jgi:hypothetical protein
MTANTRRIGPLEGGTRPYRHWMLHLPGGIRVMSTPLTLMLYRANADGHLRALPFTQRCMVERKRQTQQAAGRRRA